jgi:transcriptional regulator with GAF, ATPase, and Fis domain/tetratricopeptide (TPR) repeat protein
LLALDERVARGAPGLVVVRTSSLDTARAVREHVVRRARASSAQAVTARSRSGASLWHEVLTQLEPRESVAEAHDPVVSVDRLVSAACGRRVVVIAPLPGPTSWDRSVAFELAAVASPLLVVFVTDSRGDAHAFDAAREAELFEISGCLDPSERETWWSLLAEAGAREMADLALPELESWWTRARRAGAASARTEAPWRGLTDAEAELVTALQLVGRPWLEVDVAALGADAGTASGLVRDSFVRDTMGWLTIDPRFEELAGVLLAKAPPARVRHLAATLVSRAQGDPWAHARAAELYLLAGDSGLADAAVERALAQVEDGVARSEIAHRWASAVAASPASERFVLQCRAAERALAVGEGEEAHRWARAAATTAPDDASVTLLLGRSLIALGDLVAAEVTLRRGERGLVASEDPSRAAQLSVELAEVAYLKGDMAAAGRGAREALAMAEPRADARDVVLKARNTLGKILLSEAKWDEADRHFAEDALTAASSGDTAAELRARLNRGITFLSRGALDEARSVFEEVRAEGERLGNFRASAFALDNLAVVATWRHDYFEAIRLYERTLDLWRRFGDRLTVAHIVGNLAELRRKLGLFEHAEHAILFGRRALGPGMPPERSAHFSFVAARVALDRGHTEVAQREVGAAIRDAGLAGHRKILAEAHRVSTRIALEDGDLGRARASLQASRELMSTDEARAEVALLEALVARAAGDDAGELAVTALSLARTVGEEERLREAHLLLCETYRGRGETCLARSHLAQAIVLRDHVATALPPDVRAAFLARRDVARLSHLLGVLAEPASEESFAPPTPPVARGSSPRAATEGPRRSAAGAGATVELVGDDPVMCALRSAIKKVARSSSTVLIRGESGTGKELVAAALHRASDRAGGPMITVNCAALVETLLLSELFGHEKGAFTGATARKRGRFEIAEGGTLFLDEIGDISPRTQVALLRVLQGRTFERVGGTTPISVDVHIICATNRDLKSMVERGEFREDLYYRLCGITIDVPALRARLGDLPVLADHLLGRIAHERGEPRKSLSPSALELLASHTWPGNVRELENALRVAALFAETSEVTVAHLTENVDDLRSTAQRVRLARSQPPFGDAATQVGDTLPVPCAPLPRSATVARGEPREDGAADHDDGDSEAPLPDSEASATAVAYAQVRQGALSLSDLKRQIERDCIARALAETRGNITRAAGLLGMKRPRLSQLVKQYGLAEAISEVT